MAGSVLKRQTLPARRLLGKAQSLPACSGAEHNRLTGHLAS